MKKTWFLIALVLAGCSGPSTQISRLPDAGPGTQQCAIPTAPYQPAGLSAKTPLRAALYFSSATRSAKFHKRPLLALLTPVTYDISRGLETNMLDAAREVFQTVDLVDNFKDLRGYDVVIKPSIAALELAVSPAEGWFATVTLKTTVDAPEGGRLMSETVESARMNHAGDPSFKIRMVSTVLKLSCEWLGDASSRAMADASQKTAEALSQVAWDRLLGRAQIAAAPAATTPAPASALRSDVDDLPETGLPKGGRRHAVVIGIRGYRGQLPPAEFADGDARLMSRYLTRALGYEDANVATLINDQATKSDFEKHFDRWLPSRVKAGDEVFVYYSGHGAPNAATGDAYLMPYDGDPAYLAETAYPLSKMYAALAKLPARSTVVMDSCFSGAGGRSVLPQGARPLVTVKLGGAVADNIAVLSASAADQISHAYQEKGHGLFTYFLLKEFKTRVPSGALDMRAAFDAAAPKVSNVARRDYNNDQVPQWRGKP